MNNLKRRRELTKMIIFFACLVFGLESIALITKTDGTTFGLAMTALGALIGYWLRYSFQKIKRKNRIEKTDNSDLN